LPASGSKGMIDHRREGGLTSNEKIIRGRKPDSGENLREEPLETEKKRPGRDAAGSAERRKTCGEKHTKALSGKKTQHHTTEEMRRSEGKKEPTGRERNQLTLV